MFPKQLIIIHHISAVGSVIDDRNNENENMEQDDEDDCSPVCLKMILRDITFNT